MKTHLETSAAAVVKKIRHFNDMVLPSIRHMTIPPATRTMLGQHISGLMAAGNELAALLARAEQNRFGKRKSKGPVTHREEVEA